MLCSCHGSWFRSKRARKPIESPAKSHPAGLVTSVKAANSRLWVELITRIEVYVFVAASTGCRPQTLVPSAAHAHSRSEMDWYVARWMCFHGLSALASPADKPPVIGTLLPGRSSDARERPSAAAGTVPPASSISVGPRSTNPDTAVSVVPGTMPGPLIRNGTRKLCSYTLIAEVGHVSPGSYILARTYPKSAVAAPP